MSSIAPPSQNEGGGAAIKLRSSLTAAHCEGCELKIRIVFCGTPQFAVPTLKYLLAESAFEVVGAITQPDQPRGRGQDVSFPPIKEAALAANVPVHQPKKIRDPRMETLLRELAPDCMVIIAYGQIIPARLLGIPKLGWINLHASLLPNYRGAAPINWAIVNGEVRTGLTTMRIDEGMDTGDTLVRQEVAIGEKETAGELTKRMADLGGQLMAATLLGLEDGTLTGKPQNHAEASYAPMLKKEDGRVDWQRPAIEIYNRMRGFAPWPGAYTTLRGESCQVWGEAVPRQESANLPQDITGAAPGNLSMYQRELYVTCGDTTVLRLGAVKVEGRKIVKGFDFANGARLKGGERFG